MVVLRNKLTAARSGGPRQFSELRERIMLSVGSRDDIDDLKSELDRYDLRGRTLKNAPVLVAEPRNRVADVLERVRQLDTDDVKVRQAIDEVSDESEGVVDATSSVLEATSRLISNIRVLPMVTAADFVYTHADYGPENLRVSPSDMETLSPEALQQETATMDELNDKLGLRDAWTQTQGENAVVAIFDTAFTEGMFDSGRIVNTFSGSDVESVYRSEEGHGTMTAGAAAASTDDGLPFNGSAPGADVILVRITDSEGQIRDDIISQAWDWLMDLNLDRPIVANHSYGTPLCTGRPRARFCQGAAVDVVKIANSDSDITSVYAAGNEANTCGHRPSGITNAVTGVNSIAEVVTVGALRFDQRDAQSYSSHGRGDCAPIADPKPNVTCTLPNKTYYGVEQGWEVKDMSSGIGGSSGGTSHAAPTVAGMIALIQSKAVDVRGEPLQTEEVKQIIHESSEPPRPTQINMFGGFVGQEGYDARFGHGQLDINQALNEV